VISYSLAQKKIFLSKVIAQDVRDVSFSDEEYITEVELIQKMEAQFQQHLASAAGVDASEFTTAARGAYKTKEIADKCLIEERERYLKNGYSAMVMSDFEYSD
jgi:hypothetical protein